jgi:hypothetical protein
MSSAVVPVQWAADAAPPVLIATLPAMAAVRMAYTIFFIWNLRKDRADESQVCTWLLPGPFTVNYNGLKSQA